ncbi:uncharacterized protein DS421_10g314590 [Arachis hypogaea]|nr:uncharacterized protein DS421_10g314590 [Arachis hypogaea]
MASLPSPWLGSHRRELSLSAPPSGLPPPLRSAAVAVAGVLVAAAVRGGCRSCR